MKLGIFTDSHYSSREISCGKRYNSQSLRKIKEAYAAFQDAHCNLIVCLGDLTDTEDTHELEAANLRSIAQVIHGCPIPTVCMMGNHDAFAFTQEEFYHILGGCHPKDCCIEGKNLFFLDACYFKTGIHYAPGDSDWTDTHLPDPNALETLLQTRFGDTYVFIHQNLDPSIPEDHRLDNADLILDILSRSGTVKAVYQGHYHPGKAGTYRDLRLVTFPAMCEGEHVFYIEDI